MLVQFFFAGKSDVLLFPIEALLVLLPVLLVLLEGLLFAAGQGELKRGVDPFQGLVEIAHEDHAVVVLMKDIVDLFAEVINQEGCGRPRATSSTNSGTMAIRMRRRKVMRALRLSEVSGVANVRYHIFFVCDTACSGRCPV